MANILNIANNFVESSSNDLTINETNHECLKFNNSVNLFETSNSAILSLSIDLPVSSVFSSCNLKKNCNNQYFQKKIKNRSYRFFNGAINDVKNRFSVYRSDFVDALNFQCLTSVVFMFFASFAPAITFGGLMSKYTNKKIGTIEALFAQCICGVIWGLFSAQPLIIMSTTGPVLIFEASLSKFCDNLNLDFLSVRFYTGIWIFIIAVSLVAVDGSRLLKFVTRFTEDIFATLISAIFIAESFHFVWHTFRENPVENYQYYLQIHSNCRSENLSNAIYAMTSNTQLEAPGAMQLLEDDVPIFNFFKKNSENKRNQSKAFTLINVNETVELKRQLLPLFGLHRCSDAEPNTALLTAIIMFGTFILAYLLKKLRESFYLGRHIRRAIGDFGVLISIAVITLFVYIFIPDPYLQRIDIPDYISLNNTKRCVQNFFYNVDLSNDNWSTILVAFFAAFLIFILLFVETEITQILLIKKERGCRKGSGMNWDLILLGILSFVCSTFGLPWMCAAAVQSLAHCSSLTVMKKKTPGDKTEVNYVIEQRVTTIGVSLLIGLIAFGGSYLRLPLASLFGVFLYLGIMNLSGVQLIQRIMLFFIPKKYFPSTTYTQQMNIWRMHMYTLIQMSCLLFVFVIKYFQKTALAFPFVLMLFIIFRQIVLPKFFTEKELQAVDGECLDKNNEWIKQKFYSHSLVPV